LKVGEQITSDATTEFLGQITKASANDSNSRRCSLLHSDVDERDRPPPLRAEGSPLLSAPLIGQRYPVTEWIGVIYRECVFQPGWCQITTRAYKKYNLLRGPRDFDQGIGL
jgi:hypothetical protein